MATLHDEVGTKSAPINDDREINRLPEDTCTGIAINANERFDSAVPLLRRNGVSGFQHSFEFCESRTDSATTVRSMDDLLAEAGQFSG